MLRKGGSLIENSPLDTLRRAMLRAQYQAACDPAARQSADRLHALILKRWARIYGWRPTAFGRMRKVEACTGAAWPAEATTMRAELCARRARARSTDWRSATFGRARHVSPEEAALWPPYR